MLPVRRLSRWSYDTSASTSFAVLFAWVRWIAMSGVTEWISPPSPIGHLATEFATPGPVPESGPARKPVRLQTIARGGIDYGHSL